MSLMFMDIMHNAGDHNHDDNDNDDSDDGYDDEDDDVWIFQWKR